MTRLAPRDHDADVLIVGAGPVGLFAVFQCGMLGLSAVVVDSLPQAGGQCAALYPDKPIYDIPAIPSIEGGVLVEQLLQQARPFKPVYLLAQQVTTLERDGEAFVASTSSGVRIATRAVLIAAGVGSFRPNRPPLPGLEQFEGKGVFYSVEDRAAFDGRRVVIVGGGDSALDWAVTLADSARSVTLVHRRPKFTAAVATVDKMNALVCQQRVQMRIPGQVTDIHGEQGAMTHVTVSNTASRDKIEADAVLFFLGLASTLGPIGDWGLAMDRGSIAVDPTTMETSAPGVFAIGDIATYPHKLKLILCGFSEAALAAHAIHRFVRPEQLLVHQHSTHVGIPTLEAHA